jgi:hypothetical protein
VFAANMALTFARGNSFLNARESRSA